MINLSDYVALGSIGFGAISHAILAYQGRRDLRQLQLIREQEVETSEYKHRWGVASWGVFRLADANGSGELEFDEKVDAWERMGFKGPFVENEEGHNFPYPMLEHLELAIDSYKKEGRR